MSRCLLLFAVVLALVVCRMSQSKDLHYRGTLDIVVHIKGNTKVILESVTKVTE